MGSSCTRRHFLLSICILQLLFIIERQTIDFLGFMWAPILVNFFHIIFVIFGFFGAYTFRIKYLVTYGIWNFLWIGWNIFLICFYLNVGELNRDSDILNLGTGSVSWFEVNGYGCKPTYPTNITSEDPFRPVRPERVDDCLLDYFIVEIIHSGLHCLLAFLGLIAAICIGRIFIDEDDSSSTYEGKSKRRQSLYSIEYGPPVDAIRGHEDSEIRGQMSPKPMTPRRVKRRSVMTRGTTSRQSSQSRRSHHTNRSSTRSSRRKVHQNPVTKLLEQQQSIHGTAKQAFPSFVHHKNPDLTVTNLKSLNNDYVINSNINNFNQPHPMNTFQQNITPDPIYYNMNASSPLIQQQTSWNSGNTSASTAASQGHSNPSYQHSTPNLSHSPELNEEVYTNRPPSVRSSYSNFHGARPLTSYHHSVTAQENVFVGINTQFNQRQPQQHKELQQMTQQNQLMQQQQQQQNQQQQRPPPIPSPPAGQLLRHQTQPKAIPQVPQKRSVSRESIRSMAFISNGPPAYNLNYHTPPDSETTM